MPAAILTPGEVLGFGAPVSGVLDCGAYPRGTDLLIEQVAAGINGPHLVSRPVADALRLKYSKLLSNLLNGVSAITGLPYGDCATLDLSARLRAEGSRCTGPRAST